MPADAPSTPAGGLQVAAPLAASLIAVLLAAAAAAVLRRRPRPAAVPENEPTISEALERLGLVVRTLRTRT